MNTKTNKQAANQQACTTTEASDKPVQPTKIILASGVATLLSPGSTTTVGYEVGHEPEQAELLIRLTGSSGGGLCSKEWFGLAQVIDLLNEQQPDKAFTSGLFKVIWNFKGSSNNAGFLAAVLRHLELTKVAPEVRFGHLITGKHSEWFDSLKGKLPEVSTAN
ncbi:hypothetical protein KW556_02445 [Aeromonas veronii]|uniref:Uncharacterized protein n=1 Tax=Aeromonas caviae TaxID=648 RepID=A0A6S4T2N0_AERCA|nr:MULTISPECIES: hypothetical protein [Aeromonas]UWH28631.1 hypothetical protein KW556_02445 [Aeromonas veronii]BBQ28861.1 hypothetical protein WP2W18E01_04430 [Aeromonas caviae]